MNRIILWFHVLLDKPEILTDQPFVLFNRFMSEYRFDVSKLEPLVAKVSVFGLFDYFSLTECVISVDRVHLLEIIYTFTTCLSRLHSISVKNDQGVLLFIPLH